MKRKLITLTAVVSAVLLTSAPAFACGIDLLWWIRR